MRKSTIERVPMTATGEAVVARMCLSQNDGILVPERDVPLPRHHLRAATDVTKHPDQRQSVLPLVELTPYTDCLSTGIPDAEGIKEHRGRQFRGRGDVRNLTPQLPVMVDCVDVLPDAPELIDPTSITAVGACGNGGHRGHASLRVPSGPNLDTGGTKWDSATSSRRPTATS